MERKSKAGRSPSAELFDWVESAVFAVILLIIVFTFFLKINTVRGGSMENTFFDGEKVLVSAVGYTPTPGDVVIVSQPGYSQTPLIKRIIATEGMEVDIDFEEGRVYVDGLALEEPYTAAPTYLKDDVDFPVTVEPGHIFVMGDNRNKSTDSRAGEVGQIDVRNILGKVYLRVFPFSKFGVIH